MNLPSFDLNKIFKTNNLTFLSTTLEVFHFQYQFNPVYQSYINTLNRDVKAIQSLAQIPFLPIQFFKTHPIKTTTFEEEVIFTSSGTTRSNTSQHFIKDCSIYEKSCISTFQSFYGNIEQYCIIGLLPSYLERTGSSLIYMTQKLIELSKNEASGFYLDEFEQLKEILLTRQSQKLPTIVIGVTFALIDFALQYELNLSGIIFIETGGMKGRGKELTRYELHDLLKTKLQINNVDSEFGMTELLSQAYSTDGNKFQTSQWMKAMVRSEDDPFQVQFVGKGLLNIIDLANVYSCSFIATDDIVEVDSTGQFDVLGRFDTADMRGCSLLTT